jgi:hypothetical protein
LDGGETAGTVGAGVTPPPPPQAVIAEDRHIKTKTFVNVRIGSSHLSMSRKPLENSAMNEPFIEPTD